MQIYIPTRTRWNNQRTWNELTPELKSRCHLVTDPDQADKIPSYARQKYEREGTKIIVLPEGHKGIAAVRQWIMDNAEDRYIVMLDDDMTLHVKNEHGKIVKAQPADVDGMFEWLEDKVSGVQGRRFVHAGITPRFLNWNCSDTFKVNTRMMHVLAYDREAVAEAGCRFTKNVPESFSMDDFHMTLQLLRAGLQNIVNVHYCTNPSASNAEGGASTWRTTESHNASAEALKANHPDFVTVKIKQDWKGMGSGQRKDVTVQWQKAFNKSA